jgi:hypothetical protein
MAGLGNGRSLRSAVLISLKNRSIFNLCNLHSSQDSRGASYGKLLRSFSVTFCDYTIFHAREDFVNRFSFRNAEGEELLNAVGIIFIELSKFGKILKKPQSERTAIEMWSVFFAASGRPEYREALDEIIECTGLTSSEIERLQRE